MAIRKKAKGKTKAKGKKRPLTKAARRKTAAVRKKPTKKAPARRAPTAATTVTPPPALPVAAKPTQPAAAKAPARRAATSTPAVTAPPAPPLAAKPTPGLAAEPAQPEERIGIVTHHYSHLSVATLRLDSGTLRVGDVIHIHGHTTDFRQRVESLEVNHAPVSEVGPNDDFGVKVVDHAREHDVVYRVLQ